MSSMDEQMKRAKRRKDRNTYIVSGVFALAIGGLITWGFLTTLNSKEMFALISKGEARIVHAKIHNRYYDTDDREYYFNYRFRQDGSEHGGSFPMEYATEMYRSYKAGDTLMVYYAKKGPATGDMACVEYEYLRKEADYDPQQARFRELYAKAKFVMPGKTTEIKELERGAFAKYEIRPPGRETQKGTVALDALRSFSPNVKVSDEIPVLVAQDDAETHMALAEYLALKNRYAPEKAKGGAARIAAGFWTGAAKEKQKGVIFAGGFNRTLVRARALDGAFILADTALTSAPGNLAGIFALPAKVKRLEIQVGPHRDTLAFPEGPAFAEVFYEPQNTPPLFVKTALYPAYYEE